MLGCSRKRRGRAVRQPETHPIVRVVESAAPPPLSHEHVAACRGRAAPSAPPRRRARARAHPVAEPGDLPPDLHDGSLVPQTVRPRCCYDRFTNPLAALGKALVGTRDPRTPCAAAVGGCEEPVAPLGTTGRLPIASGMIPEGREEADALTPRAGPLSSGARGERTGLDVGHRNAAAAGPREGSARMPRTGNGSSASPRFAHGSRSGTAGLFGGGARVRAPSPAQAECDRRTGLAIAPGSFEIPMIGERRSKPRRGADRPLTPAVARVVPGLHISRFLGRLITPRAPAQVGGLPNRRLSGPRERGREAPVPAQANPRPSLSRACIRLDSLSRIGPTHSLAVIWSFLPFYRERDRA